MRGFYGALVVATAALLVCCNADPHREQDVSGSEQGPKRYDLSGHKNRVSHPVFEGDGGPRSSYGVSLLKMLDYIARPKDQNKYPLSPMETSFYYGGMSDDYAKRNFDEIDRSNLDTFVAKRNFDEIDRSSMPFPYATKRFYHVYGNHLDLDTPVSSFDKKRYRPDYPMDEIDLSHFPIGSKRSQNNYPPHNLQ